MSLPPLDQHRRPLRNLRLSVTDRCNLRCAYCMPEQSYVWLPKQEILTFDEIGALVDVFLDLGVNKVRLTGGEPLLRKDLPTLVAALAKRPRIRDLALTTNGLLLAEQAEALARAGLHRVTVSLDTLRAERFLALSRRDQLADVLRGIEAAARAGFRGTKLDTVVMRGVNDDEMPELLAFARAAGAELRFIEYMDVGGATAWRREDVVPRAEMLERLAARLGPIEALDATDEAARAAPADRFRLADGGVFGIISSTTEPFCGSCDRSRLTADGHWYLCLYARLGIDLKARLRAGATPAELAVHIATAWSGRADRGAEDRLALESRGALAAKQELDRNPRLEMHTRGG